MKLERKVGVVYGIHIPKEVVNKMNINVGDTVLVDIVDGKIVLEKK